MNTTIRRGVFETNSSSTHSITILSQEDYDKWRDEDLFYDEDEEKFYTREEVYDLIRNDEYIQKNFSEQLNDIDWLDEYWGDNRWEFPKSIDFDSNLEEDVNHFTTKSGDNIVIICRYGYD